MPTKGKHRAYIVRKKMKKEKERIERNNERRVLLEELVLLESDLTSVKNKIYAVVDELCNIEIPSREEREEFGVSHTFWSYLP